MSSQKRDYDSTVARIAGNIAAGMTGRLPGLAEVHGYDRANLILAEEAVDLARCVVASVKRTESPLEPTP